MSVKEASRRLSVRTLPCPSSNQAPPNIESSAPSKLAPRAELREYLARKSTNNGFLLSRLRKVCMERRITAWFSQNLSAEMPLVAYGHAGQPLLMFPTAAADYLEYERFHLVDAIKPLIESGRLRAYSINSVNRYSLLNEEMTPNLKAELLTRFDRY